MIRRAKCCKLLYRYDFVALAQQMPTLKVRRRYIGLDLLKQGKAYAEVADILGVSWVSVRNWLVRL